MAAALVWSIALASIAGVLFRPREWPEAVWACAGALLLVLLRLVAPSDAAAGVAKGTDVYLFLTGMMILAELARLEGVFDWIAGVAVGAARRSKKRLFALIYAAGVLVTVFLSNDATAVVLTPAVYASVRRARAVPLPYLLICAFIANAASFVLPISNPANLVVYGKRLPALVPWLRTFSLASLLSIAATYIALRWVTCREVEGAIDEPEERPRLTGRGKLAGIGILSTGAVLIFESALGRDLGTPTCLAAIAVLLATRARGAGTVLRNVTWSVLPLVAGLFVIVEALNRAGALTEIGSLLERAGTLPRPAGALAASFGVAAISNVMNNLPAGLMAGGALHNAAAPPHIRDAVLVGVDLGPNLSVTGSLATVLWLIALRREGVRVSAWEFLKIGAVVMPPALLLATGAVAVFSR